MTDSLTRLTQIPGVTVRQDIALAPFTRFDIGGPARFLIDVRNANALAETTDALHQSALPVSVIGGGSNLVVSDNGFPGAILRYVENNIEFDDGLITVAAGAILQDLVDGSIGFGLRGLHTMTGIPGWLGGAIYGNAGAYGHSIHEFVESVRYFDCLSHKPQEISNAACQFDYRESIFKRQKDWIILSAKLNMKKLNPVKADPRELSAIAADIRKTRDAKYPPAMHCAGSIFKNLLLKNLPPQIQAQVPATVIREGKIPSAYFLEAAGAKGLAIGPIRVADYHANLIYNTGGGTAAQVHALVNDLKNRVQEKFGLTLEEEVQWVSQETL